jgi:hypothetical protein
MPFWNPFRLAAEAARADRQAMLEVLKLQHQESLEAMRSINETAGKMADASKAQAESFTAYLSLFKVSSPPESRVMRDADEYQEQLRRDGFPVDADQPTQLEWVLAQGE